MIIEASTLLSAQGAQATGLQSPGTQSGGLQAGYGVSLTDLGRFENTLHSAQRTLEVQPVAPPSEVLHVMGRPLDGLNAEAAGLSELGQRLQAAGAEMKPSDMLMATMRIQEFTLHSTLLSSIFHKGADGLQQLFRQQS